jgi:hypothetical protein
MQQPSIHATLWMDPVAQQARWFLDADINRFPGIAEVIDSTNRAEGANPHYQAAKQ